MNTENKVCFVCGRTILPSSPYYSHGPKTYICTDPNCFRTAFWDMYAARHAVDKHHHPIINGKAYVIEEGNSYEKGFGGKKFTVQFNDGTIITTDSLWHKGEVPKEWKTTLSDNAIFIN